MKTAEEMYALYDSYVDDLRSVPNVTAEYKEYTDDNKLKTVSFTSSRSDTLSVELTCWLFEGSTFPVIDIGIKNTDSGHWNTGEGVDIQDYVNAAKAALQGNYKYHRTKILKRKEVCFKVEDGWLCTRTKGDYRFHYSTLRKDI